MSWRGLSSVAHVNANLSKKASLGIWERTTSFLEVTVAFGADVRSTREWKEWKILSPAPPQKSQGVPRHLRLAKRNKQTKKTE